ncbi:MAG TPA: hypothetical protein VFB73_13975 [Chloroflexota bacterium]|nr:hypothetical protein [Chloroflexota bacterium]
MAQRWFSGLALAFRLASGITLVIAVGGAACTPAPPKPPPPPIQTGSPVAVAVTPGTRAATPAAGPTATVAPPTPPPVVAAAIAAAPPPSASVEEALEPPAGRDLAAGMIAALDKVRTARLTARLANGHRTDLIYVAPDRAALVEQDTNGQEFARYVIIGDTGYSAQASAGGNWTKVTNEGFRKQAQVFRPMQIALATGKARVLDSGAEVEVVEEGGKPAFRAVFEYGSSPELEQLGLMRSGVNLLEVVVDPTTWLPLRTREETQGAVTEVTYLEFDQPLTVEPPIP